ncbi:DUF3810 domain-containing protein [Pedobacter gandavensis]|uniref:DUF3810 domain-containing protein n=1 Tax=Pedobacter gandavensis TaxID=2679963 RepID=UPI00292FC08E|nr:DUF3810 domain-containing protein [Pedobacter gandavensis]
MDKPRIKQFVLLFSLSGIVFLAGLNSNFIEKYYSNGLYQVSSLVQRWVSSLFPFPLGDFLYVLLVLFVLRSLYLFFKKLFQKKLTKADRIRIPLQVVNFGLILYLVFKILWGLNYSRPSISQQLGISNEKYTTADLVLLGEYFIAQLNDLQTIKKERYNLDQLESKAKISYDDLKKTNPLFNYRNPAVKAVLNSWIVTKIGIEGYYNPVSGEANVNTRLPTTSLPFVTCHEIAHQLGIGREDEANLIGYLVAINSSDKNFQYSAAYNMLRSILFEVKIKSPEDYQRLYETINPVTINDFKIERAFWRKYNSDMYGYMDIALDSFLKLNNQKKGTDSYQDIVLWLYNIHKKELIQRQKDKTLQP